MYYKINTAKKSLTTKLVVTNNTGAPLSLYCAARDMYKPYTLFTERKISLTPMQQREFTLAFPLSPDWLEVYAYNIETFGGDPSAYDYTYTGELYHVADAVKTCDLWSDADTAEFVKFAEWFSLNCGILSYGDYKTQSGKYWIRYMEYLTETPKYTTTPVKISSPSRVGHISGRIEVAREQFIKYSVPKRFLILMHEFSHKYVNPKLGMKIEDESSADFMALYVYLSKGYPRIDAKDVFFNIFYSNPTQENAKRKNLINTYIADFDSGKINNLINCKSA